MYAIYGICATWSTTMVKVRYFICFESDQLPLNATPKLEGLSNYALQAIRKQNIDDLRIGRVRFHYYCFHTLYLY